MKLNALVLLPHIKIRNANMISGPLSWGFPAITSFLGAVHRLFRESTFPVNAVGVGVICHDFQPQITEGYSHRPHLYRFPIDKNGETASIVEEGRAHLDVSLVLGISGELETESQGYILAEEMQERLHSMFIAGGSVLPCEDKAKWQDLPDAWSEQDKVFRRFRHRLLPGFALVERRKELQEHLATLRETQPDATSIDALLDICRCNWEVQPERGIWIMRKRTGWFVPIPVGYRALSDVYAPGRVKNTRDQETPFRFVESLYTLGEWKSPHRLSSLQELLWHYRADEKSGLYLCTQTQGEI